jgi:hypothetical protein
VYGAGEGICLADLKLLAYDRILVGKPQGKRKLGRPRRRSLDNIKMNLREIRWDDMDMIALAQAG